MWMHTKQIVIIRSNINSLVQLHWKVLAIICPPSPATTPVSSVSAPITRRIQVIKVPGQIDGRNPVVARVEQEIDESAYDAH
jgi:hypothetical protein